MADDDFKNLSTALDSPAERFISITPNDALDLVSATRGIYLGTSGDVRITDAYGNTVTFKNLVAGVIHPIRAHRIWATGTTANLDIVALY